MPLGWRARLTAIVLAVVLHVALSISVFHPVDWSGAKDAGTGGLEIALGPEGGLSGAAEPEPEELAPQTEEVELEELPEPPPVVETVPEPMPVAPPEPRPEPEPIDVVDAQPVTARPMPVAPAPAAPSPAEPQGNEGSGGTQDSPVVGADVPSTSAGGNPGAEASYASTVLAWLEQHKRYPRVSRRRREEAVILLCMAIDATGKVLEVRLEEPSRFDRLNKAALAMVERANPLPPIPPDVGRSRLELLVPVQFFLNQR
ncbi:MAG: TonB family protein [Pseudomonadota bacterium]